MKCKSFQPFLQLFCSNSKPVESKCDLLHKDHKWLKITWSTFLLDTLPKQKKQGNWLHIFCISLSGFQGLNWDVMKWPAKVTAAAASLQEGGSLTSTAGPPGRMNPMMNILHQYPMIYRISTPLPGQQDTSRFPGTIGWAVDTRIFQSLVSLLFYSYNVLYHL